MAVLFLSCLCLLSWTEDFFGQEAQRTNICSLTVKVVRNISINISPGTTSRAAHVTAHHFFFAKRKGRDGQG